MLTLYPSRCKREGTSKSKLSKQINHLKLQKSKEINRLFSQISKQINFNKAKKFHPLSIRICNADALSISIYNALTYIKPHHRC